MPRLIGEDFDLLLDKVSAEFERLQQENNILARELVQLRGGSAGTLLTHPNAEPQKSSWRSQSDRPEHDYPSHAKAKSPRPLPVGCALTSRCLKDFGTIATAGTAAGDRPQSIPRRPRGSSQRWAELELEARSRLPPADEGLPALRFTDPALVHQIYGEDCGEKSKSAPSSTWRKVASFAREAELLQPEQLSEASQSRPTTPLIPPPRRRSSGSERPPSPGGGLRKGRTSIRSKRSGTAIFGLPELFKRLDEKGTGKLCVDDLIRLLNRNEETFEYEGLLTLLRGLNEAEAFESLNSIKSDILDFRPQITPITPEPGMKSSDLTMNYRSFAGVMDETLDMGSLEAPAIKCARSLKMACEKETQRPKFYCDASTGGQQRDGFKMSGFMVIWLETIPTMVILLNSLITGLSVDYDEHEDIWDIFENVFVAFYFTEFAVKLKMYGCSGYFLGPERWWNWFDFVCLLLSLTDTLLQVSVALFFDDGDRPNLSGLLLIKIFRLARLARLLRTLRFKIFHQLKLMVLGVFSGLRVLTWAIVLLVLLTYLVGVAMTNIANEEKEFQSVLSSMFTLFRCWTDGCAAYDGTPLAERLRKKSYGVVFMIFHVLMTMFVTVGVFNLIMAIFIDNVVNSQLSRKLKEMGERTHEVEVKFKRLFTRFVKNGIQKKVTQPLMTRARNTIQSVFQEGSSPSLISGWNNINSAWEKLRSMNVTITREVFKNWLEDDDFHSLLEEAEIESSNQAELFDVLDADMGGELSMDELTDGLMQLRGPVTKADIVAVRLRIRYLTKVVESLVPFITRQEDAEAEEGKQPWRTSNMSRWAPPSTLRD